MTPEQHALLLQINAKLDALLAAKRPRSDEHAAEVISAIHQRVGSALFTTAELIANSRLIGGEALLEALAPFTSGKRLGRFLRRHAGTPHGGLMVELAGSERSGRLWLVIATM